MPDDEGSQLCDAGAESDLEEVEELISGLYCSRFGCPN
jgi:hypothetical protein